MDCTLSYFSWAEDQESLRFDVEATGAISLTIELIDLEGEVMRRKSYQLRSGMNYLTFGDLGNLLPGSYGYRLTYSRQHQLTGVVTKI